MNRGDLVTWLHEPRGGYGYVWPVDGIIEKIGPKRIKIRVQQGDEEVSVWVTPARLKLRQPT